MTTIVTKVPDLTGVPLAELPSVPLERVVRRVLPSAAAPVAVAGFSSALGSYLVPGDVGDHRR